MIIKRGLKGLFIVALVFFSVLCATISLAQLTINGNSQTSTVIELAPPNLTSGSGGGGGGNANGTYNHTEIILYGNQTFIGNTQMRALTGMPLVLRGIADTVTPVFRLLTSAGVDMFSFNENFLGTGSNVMTCLSPCGFATNAFDTAFTMGGGVFNVAIGILGAGTTSFTTTNTVNLAVSGNAINAGNSTINKNVSIGDSLFIGDEKINKTRAKNIYNYSLVPVIFTEVDPVYTADIPRIVYNDIQNTIDGGGPQTIQDSVSETPLVIQEFSVSSAIWFQDIGDGRLSLLFGKSPGNQIGRIFHDDNNNSLDIETISHGGLRIYSQGGATLNGVLDANRNNWLLDSLFSTGSFSGLATFQAGQSITGGNVNFLTQAGNLNFFGTGGNITRADYVEENNTLINKNLTLRSNKIYSSTANILDLTKFANGTGVYNTNAIVVPHQTFDITSITSLNTNYNNTLDRPIRIDASVECTTTLLADVAYANMTKGFSQPLQEYMPFCIESIATAVSVKIFGTASMEVQPGEQWAINTTLGGSGTVSKRHIWKTIE